jgi:hypothetical protein
MSEREYSGEPIDMSWQTPPWQNGGETLDAYDSEGDGKIMTDNWPANATDPEELNDKQEKMILTAANYPDIDSPSKLVELSGLDVSKAYPQTVLQKHWPERFWGASDAESFDELDISLEELRQHLLDGGSINGLVEKYQVGNKYISRLVRGEADNATDCDIPPLEWLGSEQRWVIDGGSDNNTPKDVDKSSPGEVDVTVDEIRRRALNGETAVEIAGSMGITDSPIRKRLRGYGGYADGDYDIPELEYSRDHGWHIPGGDGETDIQDDGGKQTDLMTHKEQAKRTVPTSDKPPADQTTPRWVWGVLLIVAAWVVSKILG